jgi:hypothetical protein
MHGVGLEVDGKTVGDGMIVVEGAGEDVGASVAAGQKKESGLSSPRCEKASSNG